MWDLIQTSTFPKANLVKAWLQKLYGVDDSLDLQIRFDEKFTTADCTPPQVKIHLMNFIAMFGVKPAKYNIFKSH